MSLWFSVVAPWPLLHPILVPLWQNDLNHLVIVFPYSVLPPDAQWRKPHQPTSQARKFGAVNSPPAPISHPSFHLFNLVDSIHRLHSFHPSDLPQATLFPLSLQPVDLFFCLLSCQRSLPHFHENSVSRGQMGSQWSPLSSFVVWLTCKPWDWLIPLYFSSQTSSFSTYPSDVALSFQPCLPNHGSAKLGFCWLIPLGMSKLHLSPMAWSSRSFALSTFRKLLLQ